MSKTAVDPAIREITGMVTHPNREITLTEREFDILLDCPISGAELTPIRARFVARQLYYLARRIETRVGAEA